MGKPPEEQSCQRWILSPPIGSEWSRKLCSLSCCWDEWTKSNSILGFSFIGYQFIKTEWSRFYTRRWTEDTALCSSSSPSSWQSWTPSPFYPPRLQVSFCLAPNPLPGQPSLTPSQINFFFLSVPKAAGLGLVVWNKRIQLNIFFYIKMWHLPWGPDKSSACPSSSGSYSGKKGSAEALGPVSERQTKWWLAVPSAGIYAHVTGLGFSCSLWGPSELVAFMIVVCLIWSSLPHLLTPDSDPSSLTLTLSLSQDFQSIFISSASSVNSMGIMQRECVPETIPAHGQSIQYKLILSVLLWAYSQERCPDNHEVICRSQWVGQVQRC